MSVATEVKHGTTPTFTAQVEGRPFGCVLQGRYTTEPDLGAGGVTYAHFASERPEKQRNELLVLRTSFLEWFLAEYQAKGATRDEAILQVQDIVDGWRERGAP